MTSRAGEISEAVAAWGHEKVAMLTHTLRHARGDDLHVMQRVLAQSYSRMKLGRDGARTRQAVGHVGDIRGAEQTHGKNGWHPHLHTLWFLRDKVNEEELGRVLAPAWRKAVASAYGAICTTVDRAMGKGEPISAERVSRVLGTRFVRATDNPRQVYQGARRFARLLRKLSGKRGILPSLERGLVVTRCSADGAARYISKLGLEVSAVTSKTGSKDGQRTSWQIAQDAAAGCKRSRRLWAEHARAMKGSRLLTWSRGLRGVLGLGKERSDAELSEVESTEDERQLAVIDGQHWQRTARKVGQLLVAEVYTAYQEGRLLDLEGVTPAVTPFATPRAEVLEPRRQIWEDWRSEHRGAMTVRKCRAATSAERVRALRSIEGAQGWDDAMSSAVIPDQVRKSTEERNLYLDELQHHLHEEVLKSG